MSKPAMLKAVRANCLDCMCGQANEIKLCTEENRCPLWPYRLGKDPDKREVSEEQRQIASDRMKAMRARSRTTADTSKTE